MPVFLDTSPTRQFWSGRWDGLLRGPGWCHWKRPSSSSGSTRMEYPHLPALIPQHSPAPRDSISVDCMTQEEIDDRLRCEAEGCDRVDTNEYRRMPDDIRLDDFEKVMAQEAEHMGWFTAEHWKHEMEDEPISLCPIHCYNHELYFTEHARANNYYRGKRNKPF
jgi:hypothetical protein